jgi:hypothetical protein
MRAIGKLGPLATMAKKDKKLSKSIAQVRELIGL